MYMARDREREGGGGGGGERREKSLQIKKGSLCKVSAKCLPGCVQYMYMYVHVYF